MGKKRALGRGLDALLPEGARVEAAAASGDRLREIPVDRIRTNPRQSRQVFDQQRLAELAASITEVGLVQPVVVRQSGDGYELISGERRLRAFVALGRKSIPAVIREMPEAEAAMAVLIENIQREDLNPLEEAVAYRRLLEEFDLTQEETARRVGKSRPHVTNTLRLLSLPLQVQEMLGSGALTAGHARALAAVDDAARQVELAQRAVARGLSVRALEEEVRNAAIPPVPSGGGRRRSAVSGLRSLLRERAGALAPRVSIRGDRNKGRLEIRYRNERELEEVLDWLAHVARRTGEPK